MLEPDPGERLSVSLDLWEVKSKEGIGVRRTSPPVVLKRLTHFSTFKTA